MFIIGLDNGLAPPELIFANEKNNSYLGILLDKTLISVLLYTVLIDMLAI